MIDIDKKMAFAFMGVKGSPSDELLLLMDKAYKMAKDVFSPKYILKEVSLSVRESSVVLDEISIKSEGLANHLKGCFKGAVLVATAGAAIDLLIKRTAVYDVALAHCISALGSSCVECICNSVQEEYRVKKEKEGFSITERFSAGYSDFLLEHQKDMISMTEANKIGVFLTDSLILLPSKTVTAVIGIK